MDPGKLEHVRDMCYRHCSAVGRDGPRYYG